MIHNLENSRYALFVNVDMEGEITRKQLILL